MNRRNAFAVGLVFVVIAVVYAALPYLAGQPVDWAGVTMLLCLGVAMTLMVWVLFVSAARS